MFATWGVLRAQGEKTSSINIQAADVLSIRVCTTPVTNSSLPSLNSVMRRRSRKRQRVAALQNLAAVRRAIIRAKRLGQSGSDPSAALCFEVDRTFLRPARVETWYLELALLSAIRIT